MMPLARILRALLLKDRPVYAHYGVTHRCNLRCRMCHVRTDPRAELTLPEIDLVAAGLRGLGTAYVSIGGGEPFLRDDLPEIVRLLRSHGLMVRVLTNGTLGDEAFTGRLLRAGLRELSVSLHSLDPERQAALYGDRETGGRVREGIARFAPALRAKGGRLLLNTVVSPQNIDELEGLHDFAVANGCAISFVPIEPEENGGPAFGEKDRAAVAAAYDRLIALKRSGKSGIFNSRRFLEQSRDFLSNGGRSWRCDAGRLYVSVDPSGGLSYCHRFPALGSLLDGGVREKLAAGEERRRALVASCPGCMRPCWAEITNIMHVPASLLEMAKDRYLARRFFK